MGRFSRAAGIAALCWFALAPAAQATFPGSNGRIAGVTFDAGPDPPTSDLFWMSPDGSAFTPGFKAGNQYTPAWSPDGTKIAYTSGQDGNDEIYVSNADFTGATRLTSNTDPDVSPAWSPDGTKIAFSSNRDGLPGVYVMNADGTGQTKISDYPAAEGQPEWSPDGAKIAYTTGRDGNTEIYNMNPDGTGAARLTNDPAVDQSPSWSPDGTKIAFARGNQIWVMSRSGTGHTQITTDGSAYASPAWSPDGTEIAAWRYDSDTGDISVSLMNPDGTGTTPIHFAGPAEFGTELDWAPVLTSYPRPKGASPFLTYLVPAYQPCTAPNRTHGAPLSFGSCAPPARSSTQLTLGTPDANGLKVSSLDSVLYAARTGDVKIAVSVSDVRKAADFTDYTGMLQVVSDVRITDRNNTPDPGGSGPGTTEDAPLYALVTCTATADTTAGSACNLTTTVNALYPGAITAGQRSVWQVGQVRVLDADDMPFLVQGLFVP